MSVILLKFSEFCITDQNMNELLTYFPIPRLPCMFPFLFILKGNALKNQEWLCHCAFFRLAFDIGPIKFGNFAGLLCFFKN